MTLPVGFKMRSPVKKLLFRFYSVLHEHKIIKTESALGLLIEDGHTNF